MPWKWLVGLGLLWTVGAAGAAMDQERSVYMALAQDTPVEQSGQVLLTATFRLSGERVVLFNSDGNLWAGGTETLAELAIYVDGQKVSSDAVMHWPAGTGLQHAFNALGVTRLAAGVHTATLVGEPLNGQAFTVGGQSNLAVFVSPSSEYRSAMLPYDTPIASDEPTMLDPVMKVFNDTLGETSVQFSVPQTQGAVVLMSSARAYGWSGDALTRIAIDGRAPERLDLTNWSVNQLGLGTEIQAPLYNYMILPKGLEKPARFSLQATSLPWSAVPGPQTRYTLGAGSRLIALYGGMRVYGHGEHLDWEYSVPAVMWAADYMPEYGWVPWGLKQKFTIPPGHPGVVFFSAKARLQEKNDIAEVEWATLRVVIRDRAGKVVGAGSLGAQNLAPHQPKHHRTLTTSYLSAGRQALAPGTYTVTTEAYFWGTAVPGTKRNLMMMSVGVPVIWFD